MKHTILSYLYIEPAQPFLEMRRLLEDSEDTFFNYIDGLSD